MDYFAVERAGIVVLIADDGPATSDIPIERASVIAGLFETEIKRRGGKRNGIGGRSSSHADHH